MFLETGVRNDRLTRLVRLAVREVAKAPANAKFGLVVVFIYTSCALFAEWIAPYGQAQIVSQPFRPWSTEFLLGTDNLGRDTFSRLIYGKKHDCASAVRNRSRFLAGRRRRYVVNHQRKMGRTVTVKSC